MQGNQKLTVFVGICLVVLVLGWFGSALSAPIELKITTVQMKHQQMGVGIERLAKYIAADARLKDKVRVRTYPAAQLYTGQEETQALIKGEIQMAYVIASAMDLVHPSMELWKL
ncbi:MAG: hypothetical protein ABIN58_08060, partial [candidate division WOR-3 bacterium]